MKETVCLVSLGCPKNLVDSEVMLGLLSKEGYPLTTEPSKAEILIVNTCSFIQDASQEAIDTVLDLSRYKKEGSCKRLIVSGCLPQRYGKALEKELPEVDLFIGTGSFQKLPQILARKSPEKSEEKSYLSPPLFLYDEKTPRILSTPSFTAYLKIAEGCSKFCTFCTVPKIRGPYRSRSLSSVLHEAERLAGQGVQELILIAQDTTAYGEDLQDGTNLERLLKVLVKVVDSAGSGPFMPTRNLNTLLKGFSRPSPGRKRCAPISTSRSSISTMESSGGWEGNRRAGRSGVSSTRSDLISRRSAFAPH